MWFCFCAKCLAYLAYRPNALTEIKQLRAWRRSVVIFKYRKLVQVTKSLINVIIIDTYKLQFVARLVEFCFSLVQSSTNVVLCCNPRKITANIIIVGMIKLNRRLSAVINDKK